MLLARCPGVQAIRDLAQEYGADTTRFPSDEEKKGERCILCGLCVRVCDEAIGQHAIGYESRGMDRAISMPFGEQSGECIGCGACLAACPRGAHVVTDGSKRFHRDRCIAENSPPPHADPSAKRSTLDRGAG